MDDKCLLEVKNLKKYFPVRGGLLYRHVADVHAVDDVSFKLERGKTLGVVGESGCGKSTMGKTIAQLYKQTAGEVIFDGQNLADLDKKELQNCRRGFQMVFQDPYESLNTRMTVGQILEEPFVIHNLLTPSERKAEVKRLLTRVGLPADAAERYPHEFSGGQRQRIGIARAVALKPKLILCDEPVSALDVSIQSQVLNLLLELQEEMNLTYVFIAHDLAVVKHISDQIGVMYLGKLVEMADGDEIYKKPLHPYTQALISAIPIPDPEHKYKRQVLEGEVPSPRNPPPGCRFHTRCPYAQDKCKREEPEFRKVKDSSAGDHFVACHFYDDLQPK